MDQRKLAEILQQRSADTRGSYRFRDRPDEEMDESSPRHQMEHSAYEERVGNLLYEWIDLQLDAPCPKAALEMAEVFKTAAQVTPLIVSMALVQRQQKQTDSKERSVVDQVKTLLNKPDGQSGAPAQPPPSVIDDIFKQFPGLRDAA